MSDVAELILITGIYSALFVVLAFARYGWKPAAVMTSGYVAMLIAAVYTADINTLMIVFTATYATVFVVLVASDIRANARKRECEEAFALESTTTQTTLAEG